MTGQKIISVVVPCYNEEEVVANTIERLGKMAAGLKKYQFELIFVDDGSSDKTREILRRISEDNRTVHVVALARNFGHQIAVTAGIDAARGDAVVLIDADLQDPPEVIPQMISRWEEGYDVVYGTRISRSGESAFKLATARCFYRLLNRLSEIPIPLDTGDFRLMDRGVVDVLKSMPERHRFIRGMVTWVGFRQIELPYERAERLAGISKYPLRKMIAFALDGILSFSSKPLRLAMMLGIISSFLACFGIVYAFYMRIFTAAWVEGWTALMIAVLFIGGIQLIALGVIGEYLARVYTETKSRPLYVVDERASYGFSSADCLPTPAETQEPTILRRQRGA